MRTILVDTDIVAYKVAFRNQTDYDFGDTGKARVLEHDTAIANAEELVNQYAHTCKADRIIVCLTDEVNFRKQMEPTYKANRKDVERPELLQWVKDYLASEYQTYIRPRLEADDVMGILQTSGDRFIQGETVIVSEDKDMRTIPGLLYNPNHHDQGIQKISPLDAKLFHLWQTVVGDPTDGYGGCPGIGMGGRFVEYAPDIVECSNALDAWDIVLMAYASKGLTEDDAIHQARLARILQEGDYNHKTKGIHLWNPTCLLW